jgi:hypothetical protein
VDIWTNAAMRVTERALAGAPIISAPDPEHERLIRAGFSTTAGRIYLTGYAEQRAATANTMNPFEGEWWVNDVHLESTLSPTNPRWRLDVLQQGLRLVVALLPDAEALVDGQVQALINLQSTVDDVDPEIDFSVGAVHFHRIRTSTDDLRLAVEDTGQPVMIVTTEPVGPDRGSTT